MAPLVRVPELPTHSAAPVANSVLEASCATEYMGYRQYEYLVEWNLYVVLCTSQCASFLPPQTAFFSWYRLKSSSRGSSHDIHVHVHGHSVPHMHTPDSENIPIPRIFRMIRVVALIRQPGLQTRATMYVLRTGVV